MTSGASFGVGQTIGNRFLVEAEIGRGGMGCVLRVKDRTDGTLKALKFCLATEPEARQRFAREIRISVGVIHPNVMEILDFHPEHDPPYLVMPLADCSLASLLPQMMLCEDDRLKLFLQVCEGVAAIHSAGAIHRDIKPHNVLVWNGVAVISDLGLAKLEARESTPLTRTMAVVGTEMYLAPEQRMPGGSRGSDRRTDIYQLGKLLYELLTKAPPVLIEPERLPGGLAHVVRKATHEHPDRRFASVGELMDAVRAYQEAIDPNENPVAAFDAALARIAELLRENQYKTEDLRAVVTALTSPLVTGDSALFLELFDRVPKAILTVAPSALNMELVPFLQGYVAALDAVVGSKTFSYAEDVAARMQALCSRSVCAPEIQSLALEAVLMAAARLHRFAAMESFNTMLLGVQEQRVVEEVVDMLDRREADYALLLPRISSVRLHPMIRAFDASLRRKIAKASDGSGDSGMSF